MRSNLPSVLSGSKKCKKKIQTFAKRSRLRVEKQLLKIGFVGLFESLPDAVSLSLPTGEIILANPQLEKLFGYKASELPGRNLNSLAPQFYRMHGPGAPSPRNAGAWSRRYQNIRARHQNGREFGVAVTSRWLRSGRHSLVLNVFSPAREGPRDGDNWLRTKMEAEARAEELSAILDAAPGMTLIARDPKCRVMTGGRVTYDILRLPYGVNLSKSGPKSERPFNFRVFKNRREVPAYELPVQKSATSGREIRDSELTIVFDNGDSRDFLGNAAPLLTPEGKVRGAVGVFIDITERKLAERSTRELYAHMLKVQDVERRRIARDLHDSVGQNLTGLVLSLRALKNIAARLDKKSRNTLTEALVSAREATRDVRTLSRLLHPPLLQEFGLLDALRTFIRGFSEASGIKVDVDLAARKKRLNKDVETTLFRVVQEALTNVYRHSGSKSARVRMRESDGDLLLEIRDYGRGLQMSSMHPRNPKRVGIGIAGIRERLRQFSGRLELRSDKNGTVLRAWLPLSRAHG